MPTKVIPQSLPRRFSARRDLERWIFHWTLLAALGVFAAMAVPFWSGLVYTMDDLGGYHLPTRALYAQELAQGRILHWTPDLFGGFYLAGEGQVGMYHPLHVLLYRFVNLRAAFCLEVLASYPFLMAGVYLLLRRWRFRRDAAMLGALAFTFSGFALLHFVHVNAIAVLAHLPWLLLTIQMLATATTRRQRWALVALPILTAVDLGAYGLSYSVYSDVSPLAAFQELPDPPPGTPGERMLADVFNPHRLRKGNRALLAGWKRVDGYAGLEPARVLSYNSLSALRVAGVHWVARLPETEQIVGLRDCNEHWLAVPDPLPTVRLVTCARVSGDPAAALNALPLNAGVVCERPLPLAGGPVGRIKSIVERPGEIRVRAAGETAQMIVVAQSYHPGWRVSVDGTPGRVERVDGDFLGCLLPPGDHQVVFRFRPISLVAGQAISTLALALLAMGAVVALKPVLTKPSTTNHDVSRAIN
jgi:hypothetical protein